MKRLLIRMSTSSSLSLGILWASSTHVINQVRRLKASLVAQSVKNLPAVQETRVPFLGLDDSPGEGNGNPLQYSCLEDPKDRGARRAPVHGVARVGHDLATKPSPSPCSYWVRCPNKKIKRVTLFIKTDNITLHFDMQIS